MRKKLDLGRSGFWKFEKSNIFEMVDFDPNTEMVISEFHGIFDETNMDKDFSAIKKIKKIVAESHQIVKNREDEIKEVVRGWSDCSCPNQTDPSNEFTLHFSLAVKS